MIKQLILTTLLALALFHTSLAQSGCPGCMINLPDLPEDTIFLSEAPNGQAGVYYNEDISFRMPKTTTPVAANDPETPPGLTIQQITIASVTNLPPGLQWEASQLTFNPANETDGCVKFCGTPYLPGTYYVNVIITAQVFFVEQQSAFSFPIVIEPSVSTTQGFSMSNDIGCGQVTVYFNNLIIPGTQPEFSYQWNFGNGNTSIDPNPAPQTYNSPGIYEVTYQAIIDTVGFILTGVNILEASCDDLLSKPDIKISVFDPNGQEIYLSDIIQNADFPLAFQVAIPIGEGSYALRVTDDDGGIDGADDICGVVNFNQQSTGILPDGEMLVELGIIHPVDTIRSIDSVIVLQQPQIPLISGIPQGFVCDGDTLILSVSYQEGLQWYRDSVPLLGQMDTFLVIEESGEYWATSTYENGCSASAEPVAVSFNNNPEGVAFTIVNNLLSLFDISGLPQFYLLEWYLNGELITGENMPEYCIAETGVYTLSVIDAQSGCDASFSQLVNYNPDFPNCTTSTQLLNTETWHVYPNPAGEVLHLSGFAKANDNLELVVTNALGQRLLLQNEQVQQGAFSIDIQLIALPAGIYWLTSRVGEKSLVFPFVKR